MHPPAPCRAGRRRRRAWHSPSHFNPPAPCGAGQDVGHLAVILRGFQSTRPVRGGTINVQLVMTMIFISIHPPRAGRDIIYVTDELNDVRFQSTRPMRGGTKRRRKGVPASFISIHPPRAGRDMEQLTGSVAKHEFQSTRPVRGGTSSYNKLELSKQDFNPPAPCGAGPWRQL